jgi:hypothetical protein
MSATDKLMSLVTSLSMSVPSAVAGIGSICKALNLQILKTNEATGAVEGLNLAMLATPHGLAIAAIFATIAALAIYIKYQ